MRRAVARLLLLALAGCSAAPPPAPTPPPVSNTAPTTPPASAEIRVVAKVLETGPLGHGNCTQRSYRIEVVETLAGEAPTNPAWVHYEHCGTDAPVVDASNLVVGEMYRLVLANGASANFGDAPMIVGRD
jgi:hypothetical protein